MIPSTGSGLGMACTMAVMFGTRDVNCHLKPFFSNWANISALPCHSTGTRRLLDEKATCLGSWGSTPLN